MIPTASHGNLDPAALYLDLLKRCLAGSVYPESANKTLQASGGSGPKSFVRRKLVAMLAKRGYQLQQVCPYNHEARRNGRDWPSIAYTMVGLARLDNLQNCIENVLKDSVPGDFIETGVWRGGAVILMRAMLEWHQETDRTIWAADSFEGLPTPSESADEEYDLSTIPYLAVSVENVQANLQRFGYTDEQVRFLKGWFKDTLSGAPIDKLAILRLDGDLYESTMDALVPLYEKVQPGGYVIVDDYGTWPPCRQAVDEFRVSHAITEPIEDIDGTGVFWRVER